MTRNRRAQARNSSPVVSVVVSVLFILAVNFLLYRASAVRAQSQAQSAPSSCCGGNVAPRELDFPYYSLANGYRSQLLLVSDSPNPIDLTIVIRNLHGQSLLDSGAIQPQAKLTVDLASTIAKLGGDPSGAFAEGSVAVDYVGTIMPVVGQMTVTNPALSLSHEVDMVENDPGRSDIPPVLNSLWWGLGGGRDAQVMVTNTSMNPVIAEAYLEFEGSRHAVPALTFGPNETKVLDINQMLATLGVEPAQAPSGGITIVGQGQRPALIASGRITDPATGFSSTIDFPDPQLELSSALHASGLPIGTPSKDSPYAGDGTFVPQVVVRNLLSTPQVVTVTVEYPQAPAASTGSSAAASAPLDPVAAQDGAHSPPAQQYVIPAFTVPGYSTEDFSLASVMGALPLPLPFCSIRIQYSGAPGSMVAEVSSVEQNQDLIVDTPVRNEGNGWAGSGANPWHVDKNTQSILFLTNESGQPARIGFSVTANGVHYYLTTLKLNPHETRVIDLRALRDAQKADFRSNKIPAAATDGSVCWIRIDNVPVTGHLLVMTRRKGIASSYDCGSCPCPANFIALQMDSSSFACLAGETWQCNCTGEFQSCNGTLSYTSETDYADWSSDDTSVATMDSSKRGEMHAVAVGTAIISASYTGQRYTYSPTAGCRPTSVMLTGTETATVGAHPVNFRQTAAYPLLTGVLEFDYAWDSSTGKLSDLSACTVYETVNYPGSANPYIWPDPPWNTATPNPTSPTGVSGPTGAAIDDNMTGSFIKPYRSASFTAVQKFSYTCNGGALKGTLYGPLNIVTNVSQNSSGTWVYSISKSGSSDSYNLP